MGVDIDTRRTNICKWEIILNSHSRLRINLILLNNEELK